jgi:hypothetical protein
MFEAEETREFSYKFTLKPFRTVFTDFSTVFTIEDYFIKSFISFGINI